MRLVASFARLARWAGLLLVLLAVVAAGAFALLQTSIGRDAVGRLVARLASSPGLEIKIKELAGSVPFDVRATRIEIADARGVWLALDGVHLDVAALRLLGGRLHLRDLAAAALEFYRLPEIPPPPKPVPWSDTLRLPSLPVPVTIERFAIERIAVAEGVLGERIEAAVSGSAESRDTATEIALDLRRTDGVPGNLDLSLRQSGAAPTMQLRLTASEPSGVLLGRLLDRSDRPPLSVSVSGDGPVSDWHGRIDASAGRLARLEGDVVFAAGPRSTLALTGTAAVAPLLPPAMASLTGDSMPVTARATFRENGAVSVDELAIGLAAGRLAANATFAGPDRKIAAEINVRLTDLAASGPLFGEKMRGSAELTATVSGTEDRPMLRIAAAGQSIDVGGSGAERATAHATVSWTGKAGDPAALLEIAATGRLSGLVLPDAVPREFGRDLDWSLSASAAPDGSLVQLTDITVSGAGIDLAGTGKIAEYGRMLDGRMRVSVAELAAFSEIVGHRIGGALTIDVMAEQQSSDRILARFDGSAAKLHTGIPALDALTGKSVAIAGTAEREPSGAWRLDRLTATGDGLTVGASGIFEPGKNHLIGTADAEIGDLRPAGAALDVPIAGKLAAKLTVEGPVGGPRLHARLEGRDLKTGTAMLDRVRLDAEMADVTERRATIDGSFRSGGLDGTLSLLADAGNPEELAIRRMQVRAAGGSVDGDLRVDLTRLLARGKIAAKLPELAAWSRLAGVPLSGRVDMTAELAPRAGQGVDLKLTGDRLSYGAGGSRVTVGRLTAGAQLGNVLGTAFGNARASLAQANFSGGSLSSATLNIDSPKPGRFAFRTEASGRFVEKLTIAGNGTGTYDPQKAGIELRINRLAGSLGPDRFQQSRPLTISRRGEDVALSGLALAFGRGRITGGAARRGKALSLQLAAQNLPVAAIGRLAGFPKANGTIALDAAIDGTLTAPRGRFSVSGRSLSLALAQAERLPRLALDVAGAWNGRQLDIDGRVGGIKGDSLTVAGAVPLALAPGSFGIALPPQGRLALRLSGGGDIANLADLLPLGEDRVTGRFALDGALGGTVAAPAASGRLTITNGQYENFATGAVLKDMRVALVGDRSRVTISEFSARDSADGSLTARGGVTLGEPGPSADLSVAMQNFRILGRDLAVVAATGTAAITGPVASPNVTARLTTDQGAVNIPASLPPTVTQLNVVEINSRTGKRPEAAPVDKAPPALPASLDLQVNVPSRVFVRGRGLDSEWRGRITVTGTSADPRIAGSLQAIRGTFDFLGKSFRVRSGRITFDGGATVDPVLEVLADVAAGDITAQVSITGPVSAPKIAMNSTPVIPQDEILSRVLFGRGVGQITPAEGLQLAAAAATLAGGGFDVLDKLRGRLGLDRLVFGSAPSGLASGEANPTGSSSAANGAAISGGKYVADGVYVGASQGLTPGSSKVVVEIELRPRVTVQGDVSQSGGSGIGLNYKFDY